MVLGLYMFMVLVCVYSYSYGCECVFMVLGLHVFTVLEGGRGECVFMVPGAECVFMVSACVLTLPGVNVCSWHWCLCACVFTLLDVRVFMVLCVYSHSYGC